ncbi:hypothetical protein ACFLV0_04145 [Chloroflexota bacterium]
MPIPTPTPTPTPLAPTPVPAPTLEGLKPVQTLRIQNENIFWDVSLYSVEWDGAEVTIHLSVTNDGDKPATFPYPSVYHPVVVEFRVVDHYNQWFDNNNSERWVSGDIYPGETRSGELSFLVNPRSGDSALYVTWYTGTSRGHLFDIGHPE